MTIKRVKDYSIGNHFDFEGDTYRVVSFPTRYTVCGENLIQKSGHPSMCKTTIREALWVTRKQEEW